jgi:transcriptional regulator with XRE-family HTH domain
MSDANDWQHRIRTARRELGLSQQALGALAHLSVETIRAYEGRRRNPTRAHLEAIIDALGLPQHIANEVLVAAGYASRPGQFPLEQFESYYFRAHELQNYVDERPWPDFVLNQTLELVAANRAIQALWGIQLATELATRSRPQLNMLAVASQHHFADRVVNWLEVVSVIVAVFKGRPRGAESLDEPNTYFGEVLAEFAKGDPAFLPALANIWEKVPGREAKCNWTYPVVWSDAEFGEMRFLGVVSTASEPDAFAFNSWIPVDADTWCVLERVKARAR